MQYNAQAGISLIEISIGIFLVMLVFAIGAYAQKPIAYHSVKNVMRELHFTLENYTSLSQALGRDVYVQYNPTNQTIEAKTQSDEITLTLKKSFEIPANINIDHFRFGNISGSPDVMILYASGRTTPGRITLSDSTLSQCTLTQSLYGRKRVECSAAREN